MSEYVHETRPVCQRPEWLTVERGDVYPKWKLVDWAYIPVPEGGVPEECSECNNQSTNIYVRALDAARNYKSGDLVQFLTPDDAAVSQLRPRGDLDYCYDPQGKTYYGQAFGMTADSDFDPGRGEVGPLSVRMAAVSSDVLKGMGLPLRRHVQYVLTFQWQEEEEGAGEPPPNFLIGNVYRVRRADSRRIVLVRVEEPK